MRYISKKNIKNYIQLLYRYFKLFIKKLIIKIKEYIIHIIVLTSLLAIFLGAFKLEIDHNRATNIYDKDFWLDNLLPNIIADMIGIILTSFIIASLFSKNQEKQQLKLLYGLMGREFESLLGVLNRNLLYLINKDVGYLTTYKNEKVEKELKKIVKDKEFNFPLFCSNFVVWDLSGSSPLYDTFVDKIPKLQSHFKQIDNYLIEMNSLIETKDRNNFIMKNLDEKSKKYKALMNKNKIIQRELNSLFYFDISADKEMLDVNISQCLAGYKQFVNEAIDGFNKKYSFIIPLDIRLTFAEIEKNIQNIYSNINGYNSSPTNYILEKYGNFQNYQEMKSNDVLNSILVVSKELLKLSSYFDRIKTK